MGKEQLEPQLLRELQGSHPAARVYLRPLQGRGAAEGEAGDVEWEAEMTRLKQSLWVAGAFLLPHALWMWGWWLADLPLKRGQPLASYVFMATIVGVVAALGTFWVTAGMRDIESGGNLVSKWPSDKPPCPPKCKCPRCNGGPE